MASTSRDNRNDMDDPHPVISESAGNVNAIIKENIQLKAEVEELRTLNKDLQKKILQLLEKENQPSSSATSTIVEEWCAELYIKKSELKNIKQIKCTWFNKLKEEKELVFYLSKNDTVADLLNEVRKQVELSENGSGRLRLLDTFYSRIGSVLHENTQLKLLPKFEYNFERKLRVEEIPTEEINVAVDEMIIPCVHLEKDFFFFGVPFLLKVKHKEPFIKVKERIQKKLEVSDEEFKHYKFARVVKSITRTRIRDTDCINLPDFLTRDESGSGLSVPLKIDLGLCHVNKAEKQVIKKPRYC